MIPFIIFILTPKHNLFLYLGFSDTPGIDFGVKLFLENPTPSKFISFISISLKFIEFALRLTFDIWELLNPSFNPSISIFNKA